ncbi:aminotransferase class V-fold PLP-dependent enzyme [Bacillus sp. CGMCC 1.16607]|uniref:aminotransferase class V-fold PLP-dependent enzyme n=1 Tax=Bacillus sp. CGMCC 1.16607 TaxID=3351842 RepID=UPI003637A2F3
MEEKNDYLFKIAAYPHEFEQIHALNYQTFSEEIPQHQKNEREILIDPFHNENTYIICLKNEELVGMIAIRDQRPFSLDRKIGPVEQALPIKVNRLCEIRLLAVKKEYRNGRVFVGLAQYLAKYGLKKGYDACVISGTVRQAKLYKQMGFLPFAPLTGTDEAQFQPLYLTKQTFEASLAGRILRPTIPFLPGPVRITDAVIEGLSNRPISHRSEVFFDKIEKAKKILKDLVRTKHVQILLGSGTLANDVIAGQLSLEKGKGIILVNGEFGSRLVEQANRFGLNFDIVEKDWGQVYTKEDILSHLSKETTWMWGVHSETSTGMLNNLNMLKDISKEHNLKLCLDCISSIGAVELDLEGVYLASGVSGKALKAITGLSFVFHHHDVKPSMRLPKYIDLGYYLEKDSIPFSHSSNLLEALLLSLEELSIQTFDKVKETYHFIRNELFEKGFKMTTPEQIASPIIITIEIPKEISSTAIGESVLFQGFQLHYESSYLKERNWIQIACVGDYSVTEITSMIQLFSDVYLYEIRNSNLL